MVQVPERGMYLMAFFIGRCFSELLLIPEGQMVSKWSRCDVGGEQVGQGEMPPVLCDLSTPYSPRDSSQLLQNGMSLW